MTTSEQSKSLLGTFGSIKKKFGNYDMLDLIEDRIKNETILHNECRIIFDVLENASDKFFNLKVMYEETQFGHEFIKYLCYIVKNDLLMGIDRHGLAAEYRTRVNNYISMRYKIMLKLLDEDHYQKKLKNENNNQNQIQ